MLIFSSAGALSGAGPNEPACPGDVPVITCVLYGNSAGSLNMLSFQRYSWERSSKKRHFVQCFVIKTSLQAEDSLAFALSGRGVTQPVTALSS